MAGTTIAVGNKTESLISYKEVLFSIPIVAGLYVSSTYSYLLFHSLAELFSIIVACCIFIIAWNTRRITDNSYFIFIGIAYLFVALIDLLHTLGYPGMGVFSGYDTNLPTQLWIAGRYTESISLLTAPLLFGRKLEVRPVLIAYFVIISFMLTSIFYWQIFPNCFIEGAGLTLFKKGSEYVISIIFFSAILLMYWKRHEFDKGVFYLLIASLVLNIAAELAFTFYIHAYGLSNLGGHLFKLASFYLIYKAIIESGLTKPYGLLFRNLKKNEEELTRHKNHLEIAVHERTYELKKLNEKLLHDIAIRKQTETALRHSEEKFSKAFRSSPTLISISTLDEGRYIEINDAFLNTTGYLWEDVIGHTEAELGLWVNPDDRVNIVSLLLKHRIVTNFETGFRVKSGNIITVLFSAELIDIESKPHMLAVVLDVTERKHLERQLLQSQKMEAVGQLAGGIAHDFNNILSAIMNYAYIADQKAGGNQVVKSNIEQIIGLSSRAADISRGLLTFSRKHVSNPIPLKINDTVKNMEKLLSRFICEDIELSITLTDENPVILADSVQMDQIIINLATNARDAMPDGGTLTFETESITIDDRFIKAHHFGEPGKYVVLTVSDSGTGIDEETKQKIFEPFFTTKEVGKGSGLGMSIIYGIVKEHKGFINVYSDPGLGTTFRIYFRTVDARVEEPDTAYIDLTGNDETILLAEDEEYVRIAASSILKDFGYRVIEALNGQEAVEKYMRNHAAIQLCIFDTIMPKKNGREAFEDIRKIYPGVKAIFTSGYPTDVISKKGILEKDINYLPKPILPERFLRKIKDVLLS